MKKRFFMEFVIVYEIDNNYYESNKECKKFEISEERFFASKCSNVNKYTFEDVCQIFEYNKNCKFLVKWYIENDVDSVFYTGI